MKEALTGVCFAIVFGIVLLIVKNWAVIEAVLSFFFGLILLAVFVTVVIGIVRACTVGARAIGAGAEGVASWADYTFVKHPAEPIVEPALREGRELDTKALHHALMPTPSDLHLTRPMYHYENQAEKARAMTQILDENARLAEAAIRLERKRAELRDAQGDFEQAKRQAKR